MVSWLKEFIYSLPILTLNHVSVQHSNMRETSPDVNVESSRSLDYGATTPTTDKISEITENDRLLPEPPPSTPQAGSVSTIFSIWNTMVGSTLLAMPWGFRQSGIALGVIVFFLVGIISYYTCTLITRHTKLHRYRLKLEQVSPDDSPSEEISLKPNFTGSDIVDFSEVCVKHLGRWSQILALLASIIILIGAAIAYHIFMKDCLLNIVAGIARIEVNTKFPWEANGPPWYWNGIFASCVITIIVFPLSCLRKLTLLVKFNSFGVFFVLFLLVFIIYSSTYAMVYPETTLPTNSTQIVQYVFSDFVQTNGTAQYVNYLQNFSVTFSHLLAILSLSFFIHNVIVSILASKKSLRHTRRDIAIAFVFAGLCYLIPGVMGSVAFRFDPTMKQNFLNQFSSDNIYANVARGSVLLQLISIYPLLLFIIRSQVFESNWKFWKKPEPGIPSKPPHILFVLVLNILICAITTSFASFYPNVGTVLRFTGAICGLIYLYLLPILVHLVIMYRSGELRWYSIIFHSCLIILGTSVLVLQFIDFDAILKK
jgi:sodium-coupled neutral amino acid transporter 9